MKFEILTFLKDTLDISKTAKATVIKCLAAILKVLANLMAGNFGVKPMQKYFKTFKPSVTTILPSFNKISRVNYQQSQFTKSDSPRVS